MGKKQRTDKDNSSARHSHFGVSGKNGKKKLARQQQQAPAGKAGKKKQKAKLAAAAGASSSSGAFRPKGGPPYACDQPILLLGEGDFSFAAALALLWSDASQLTATAFDDEATASAKYAGLADNVATIEALGGTCLFGVDAARCHEHRAVAAQAPFERVVFNFPHTGSGIKDHARNVTSNQQLLRGTFYSAQKLLAARDAELHLTLKRGEPYDSWNAVTIAKMCGLRVGHCNPFRPELYPGYAHRRSIGDTHAGTDSSPNAEIAGSKTYSFVVAPRDAR